MIDTIWPKIIGLLLLPPGIILVIALFGLLLQIKWQRLGMFFLVVSILLLFVLSLPLTGAYLLAQLESYAPPVGPVLDEERKLKAGAIVVLGGGRYANAPEYGVDTVNALTLERLRYGTYLQGLTGLPILVTGGALYSDALSEAELMQTALKEIFNTKAQWLEKQSRNTMENAIYSQQILTSAGYKQIYLVTHSWHMRRAAWTFEQVGLDVIPAPMNFTTLTSTDRVIFGNLPSGGGLMMSSTALHEYLGLIWYKLIYQADTLQAYSQPAPQS